MKGRIVSKDDTGKLTIALMQEDDEHCKACGMGDSCGLTQVSSLEVNLGSKADQMNVDDMVDVEISSKIFLWLSGSVYILPLLTMVIGALIMSPGGDVKAIVGGFLGFLAGVIFNVYLNKYLSLQRIVQVRRIA